MHREELRLQRTRRKESEKQTLRDRLEHEQEERARVERDKLLGILPVGPARRTRGHRHDQLGPPFSRVSGSLARETTRHRLWHRMVAQARAPMASRSALAVRRDWNPRPLVPQAGE